MDLVDIRDLLGGVCCLCGYPSLDTKLIICLQYILHPTTYCTMNNWDFLRDDMGKT